MQREHSMRSIGRSPHCSARTQVSLAEDQTEIVLVQCTHAVPILLHVSLDLAFQVLDRCMKFPHISCHFEFLRVPFTLLLMLVTSSIPATEAVGTVHVTSLTFYSSSEKYRLHGTHHSFLIPVFLVNVLIMKICR